MMDWRDHIAPVTPRKDRENRKDGNPAEPHISGIPGFPVGADSESPLPARAESRRQRVLALMATKPGARFAVVTDEADPDYPGCVVITVAMRLEDGTTATADIITPAERYDGCRLLELVERHADIAAQPTAQHGGSE